MLILGIDTSCDDTSCAIVKNGKDVLSNIVVNQFAIHAKNKGVMPELAARAHERVLVTTLQDALNQSNIRIRDIDKIAVTIGPGLQPALQTGILFAKGLALSLNKPIAFINHITAHAFASIMAVKHSITFPMLGVILSGGHSTILLINSWDNVSLLGETVDDALGEAFDKVSIMLGGGFPGGPIVEAMASKGNFPKITLNKISHDNAHPFNMSFSGIKTQIKNLIQKHPHTDYNDIAAAFQYNVFRYVISKIELAQQTFEPTYILCGGGVFNSLTLKQAMKERFGDTILFPEEQLTLDNAAMIAGLGYYTKDTLHFENIHADPNLTWHNTHLNY